LLSGQLFANTQIPCCLWFLSKSRRGGNGLRPRMGEILFIDARKLGALLPGSRIQKGLSNADIERIAGTYQSYRRGSQPGTVAGFSAVAKLDQVRSQSYVLTPGRYVGSDSADPEATGFEDRLLSLTRALRAQSDQALT